MLLHPIGPGHLSEGAMDETDHQFSQGNLKYFEGSTRTIKWVIRSIHITTGRLSKTALKAVSGQEEIPIISKTSRLAEIIALSAHKTGGHKTYNDTLSRSRQIAYMYKPGNLIKC